MNFLKNLFKRKPRVEKIDITRRFDLIGRVGQGSMSKVWRARDTMTGRVVALKVLDKVKLRRLEARFLGLNRPSEGEVAITLRHPHIVHTFEIGVTRENEPFLVMEFIEGLGLSYLVDIQNELMRKNRLRFMIELGDAISYFHRQNYIHRDICPRNVMLDQDYSVKLIDFGLVVPNTPDFQKPGNRTGTANYMAPELIKRQRTDQRIDVFSYAVTCYEMFTKRFPWENAGESLDMAVQHINNPPKDVREFASGIDEQVAAAIMKGLERDLDRRWQTVSEMLREFREAQDRLEADDSEPEAAVAAERPAESRQKD